MDNFSFWMITFTVDGKQTIMRRNTRTGQVSLMSSDGTFFDVKAIPSKFHTTAINL